MNLNLGHSLDNLKANRLNGPGWRIPIFLQGCKHRCTSQCLNPQFLSTKRGYRYSIKQIVEALLQVEQDTPHQIEGLTVLGGEPFEQAEALVSLFEQLKSFDWTTLIYSGLTLAQLKGMNDPFILSLLGLSDILIDGPFLPGLSKETLMWRGSSNQLIHCLSNRYSLPELKDIYSRQKKGFSLQIGTETIVEGLQTPSSNQPRRINDGF